MGFQCGGKMPGRENRNKQGRRQAEMQVVGPIAKLASLAKCCQGAQRAAVAMSHRCREAHRAHGGVCRFQAVWRDIRGG